jgi:hypothetical protein
MLTEGIIKRLTLARYFWRLADDNARAGREVTTFAAINLLHDGVEFFLLAAMEHLNTGKANSNFEHYIDSVDTKIAPRRLPFRPKLLQLNKVRVSAKHHGVRPDAAEVSGFVVVCKEFFEEAARTIFGVDFWTISLIDLIDDKEARTYLAEARQAFERDDYTATLIECRKAFFCEFEWPYDIKTFQAGERRLGLLAAFGNRAPYYAMNPDYIERHVSEPFDYIVFDHDRLAHELTFSGIDHTVFWNIWRLTPAVYREGLGREWIVKGDFDVFDPEGIADRASYVLESTVDMILTKHMRDRSVRSLSRNRMWIKDLTREEIPLYRKADRTSEVVVTTPKGVSQLRVLSSSPGLRDDGTYWRVSHAIADKAQPFGAMHLWGYVHEEDVKT